MTSFRRMLCAVGLIFLSTALVCCGEESAESVAERGSEAWRKAEHPALGEKVAPRTPSPGAGTTGGNPHARMPAGHPPTDRGAASGEEPPPSGGAADWPSGEPFTASGAVFTPPDEWKREAPASRMRVAQFRLPHADGDTYDGELTVIPSGGDMASNIRRWQGEFQTQPEPVVTKLEANGISMELVDMRGTFIYKSRPMAASGTPREGYRVLVAAVQAPGGQVFLKAFGPEGTITKWEGEFRAMLESARPGR